MFNMNGLRRPVSTYTPPLGTRFDQDVTVLPDGTVMWTRPEDERFNRSQSSAERPSFRSLFRRNQRSSSGAPASQTSANRNHFHYHYYEVGMGPWLLIGLQLSLAIALFMTLPSDLSAPEYKEATGASPLPDPNQ